MRRMREEQPPREAAAGGAGQPEAEQQLPLDIQYAQLAEWLVDRKKLPGDWRKRLAAVKLRAARAVAAVPMAVRQAAELDADTIDYPACVRALAALQQHEAAHAAPARGAGGIILGSLGLAAGGPRKEWAGLVRAYEKHMLHVGEASQVLAHNVDYEVPFLNGELEKAHKQLADIDRKEGELHQSIEAAAARYAQQCARLGNIRGERVKEELLARLAELPEVFRAAAAGLRSAEVRAAAELYREFVAYAHGAAAAAHAAGLLPTLSSVLPPAAAAASEEEEEEEDSQVTVAAEALLRTPKYMHPPSKSAPSSVAAAPPAIDWDIELAAAAPDAEVVAAPAAIDWDIEVAAELSDGGGGGGGGRDDDGDAAAVVAPPSEIDWDVDISAVELSEEGAEATLGDSDVLAMQRMLGALSCDEAAAAATTATTTTTTGGGGQAAALSWDEPARLPVWARLGDMRWRNALLDDLYELEAFLQQRRGELQSVEALNLLAALKSAPDAVQQQTMESVTRMHAGVKRVLEVLNSPHAKDLILTHSSARFLDSNADRLHRMRAQQDKLHAAVRDLRSRRDQTQASLSITLRKLEALAATLRERKAFVEGALSAAFDNRPVNVIGQINNVV